MEFWNVYFFGIVVGVLVTLLFQWMYKKWKRLPISEDEEELCECCGRELNQCVCTASDEE
ncbi:hypothetical protein LCGC14_1092280 [marine sediment metagenome]|uniref:Uncharacterized protein n=1 Tax=marine sediment metagenome TaxID=412755 RepID=A0A0F9MC42_9ZZZZ